jgi:hypothetical protein
MMSTPMPMIRVCWTDAQGDAHGWTPLDELDTQPCIVTTVGHQIPGRADHITVALSYHYNDGDLVVDSVVHIPSAMCLSVQTLAAVPA